VIAVTPPTIPVPPAARLPPPAAANVAVVAAAVPALAKAAATVASAEVTPYAAPRPAPVAAPIPAATVPPSFSSVLWLTISYSFIRKLRMMAQKHHQRQSPESERTQLAHKKPHSAVSLSSGS
jgi:hypothetical protein